MVIHLKIIMLHLISQAIIRFNSFLKKIQVKSFLTSVLLGVFLLTSGASSYATNGANTADTINSKVFETNSERPTTKGEWQQKAQETQDEPLERAKEIVKESAEAIKEWGQVYPDVVERSLSDDQN